MNRVLLLLILTFCGNVQINAQTFRDYGVFTEQERNLKVCSFDKDADAIILMDEAHSEYNDRWNLVTYHHVRIKILTEKGLDEANIAIHYNNLNEFETISDVEGATYNDNGYGSYGLAAPIERKSVFTKKINAYDGETRFSFPIVKVGSILEYKYRSVMKNYMGLEDWVFQKELPVLHSKYKLVILPNVEFAYRVQKRSEYPIVITPDRVEGSTYFEMNEIPGLRREAYMDARANYIQKVIFQLHSYNNGYGKNNYMTSWDEVARELRTSSNFGDQLSRNLAGTGDFIAQVKLVGDPFMRMKKVYDFVSRNLSWNHYYSRTAIDGVKEAWSKKTGTSGEINLILINLLKEAGLQVTPMLVSERFHGNVNPVYPFVEQFNSVFAAVEIENKEYYLDATASYTPANISPYSILNTTGLQITKKGGSLKHIANDTLMYSDFNLVNVEIGEDGTAKGNMTSKNTEYSKIEHQEALLTDKDKYIEQTYKNLLPGITIADYEALNTDNDSLPLIQKFNFNLSLNGSGDYKFIPLNFLPGFSANPFVRDSRFSSINFGYRQSYNLNLSFNLPNNYIPDVLPQSVKLSNPDGDMIFIRKIFYDKDLAKLVCMIAVDIKKVLYNAQDYPDIYAFYKKMYDFLNEQLVLKKAAK